MEMQKHNPDYKLISVIIDGKELVYGETNTGLNPGLEVYHLIDGDIYKGHYYSRRYTGRKMPMKYDILAMSLKKLIPYCEAGQKLDLTRAEYQQLIPLLKVA